MRVGGVLAPAAALALVVATAQAQPAPQRLSLDDAMSRAIEASHRLGEARARQQGAEATVEVRRKADVPTITALAGYARTNHVDEFAVATFGTAPRVIYPDIPDNYRTRLELQWPVYTSGRSDALERAAQAEARSSVSTCGSRSPAPTGRWSRRATPCGCSRRRWPPPTAR